jgi:hypothetical protein
VKPMELWNYGKHTTQPQRGETSIAIGET